MLRELSIRNFAIIESQDLCFDSGLVILTGETGAGKSIILDALGAVLGGKVDPSVIRHGADRATVEAVFELEGTLADEVEALLEAEGLNEEHGFLSMAREIRAEGRSIARINGRSSSASLQAAIGAFLVDIHGQSEHLSLLKVRQHGDLLDRYAHNENELNQWSQSYQAFRSTQESLEALQRQESYALQRTDLLHFQVQEIEAAKLQAGEEETLRQERNRLANAESLYSLSSNALAHLDDAGPDSLAASDLLGQASHNLGQLAAIDPSLVPLAERVEAALVSIQEAVYDLRIYQEGIAFNPRRLDQIEERLDLLKGLKRKYGPELMDVLSHLTKIKRELEDIDNYSERLEKLEKLLGELQEQLAVAGQALSMSRQKAAEGLASAVDIQLEALSMHKAHFRVDLSSEKAANGLPVAGQRLAIGPQGWDKVEFLVETNPGEGFRPLVKVASGGETSRLMLALKQALAAADRIPTLVFDEIDQGIGGRVGLVVGEILWRLARQHQVMCVTHLPQLAAFADQHLHVNKTIQGERTTTVVRKLENEERIQELAAMTGPVGEGTVHNAKEITEIVRRIKLKVE